MILLKKLKNNKEFNMELPQVRRKAKRLDSKRLLLFGAPKCGKTTIVSELNDCLIIDMEEGSNYVDGMIVNVNNMSDYGSLMKSLKEAKEANGGKNPYKYICLDTMTALEEISLALALKLYKATPMGSTFSGTDVRTLPNGAGYLYTRQAFFKMLKPMENYCDTLVLIGHVKEKDLSKDGDSFTEKSINLTGQTKNILCSWCDAIGLVYREDNKTIIDFEPSDSLVVGSRQKHLIGKQIVVAESDDDHNITINWNSIFIEEHATVIKPDPNRKEMVKPKEVKKVKQ
tara:strand:- start:598 stop:1455 length:858 start_codon:yes stop_codon:yes gene_type:complete